MMSHTRQKGHGGGIAQTNPYRYPTPSHFILIMFTQIIMYMYVYLQLL